VCHNIWGSREKEDLFVVRFFVTIGKQDQGEATIRVLIEVSSRAKVQGMKMI
jgi:hypothetical protein